MARLSITARTLAAANNGLAKNTPKCWECGAENATWQVAQRDVTPTDRGPWIQEYTAWYCEECYRDLLEEYPELQ